ncbi:MAG: glycosyltransferase family 39 protein, partial [Chloroflexota bacterium]
MRSAVSVEMGLYVLIGAVAVALRLFHLGSAPLSSAEAREALAVWRFVMGQGASIQPVSPAWFTLTSTVFTLFGASEFWARLWPAVAGTALAFFPLTFRRELGRAATLIACALLAISPVMMAASRAADGTMVAAAGLWLIAYGLSRMADSRWLIAEGRWQEAVGRRQMADGGW